MEINKMRLEMSSRSVNESFARTAVAGFVAQLDPTIQEITEIKTAVSEAVSNAIIHGYRNHEGTVIIECFLFNDRHIEVTISDSGAGIDDVELARQPLYTTCPDDERSGMGFTVMESFMDSLEIESSPGHGTRVFMSKKLDTEYEE